MFGSSCSSFTHFLIQCSCFVAWLLLSRVLRHTALFWFQTMRWIFFGLNDNGLSKSFLFTNHATMAWNFFWPTIGNLDRWIIFVTLSLFTVAISHAFRSSSAGRISDQGCCFHAARLNGANATREFTADVSRHGRSNRRCFPAFPTVGVSGGRDFDTVFCWVVLWRSWLHCGTRVCKSWFLGGWFAFSARCACRTRCLCGVRKTSGSVSFFTFEFSPHQVWFVHELWNCTEIASGQIWTCSRTDMGEMRKLLGQRQWWQAIMLAWSSLAWRCSTVCFEASSKVETRSSMAITAWTANEEMKKKSLVLMDLRDRSDTYTNRWLEM